MNKTPDVDPRRRQSAVAGAQIPAIELQQVCHRFADGSPGLTDITMSIPRGGLVVVAGANGSGKTTLLKHLNGLLLADSGTVRVEGRVVGDQPAWVRQVVGLVFQDADSQIVGETVAADVAFGPENLCLDRDEIDRRVAASLATVGLTQMADQPPHLLSGGEKRRLCIAGVLAMHPRVLAMDEPLSGLDFPGTRQVLTQILALKTSGHTIVITTHDVEKTVYHTDRLFVMQKGRIVRQGQPASILHELERFGVREPCASRMGREVVSWLQ